MPQTGSPFYTQTTFLEYISNGNGHNINNIIIINNNDDSGFDSKKLISKRPDHLLPLNKIDSKGRYTKELPWPSGRGERPVPDFDVMGSNLLNVKYLNVPKAANGGRFQAKVNYKLLNTFKMACLMLSRRKPILKDFCQEKLNTNGFSNRFIAVST